MDRRRLIGGIAISILAAPMARAAQPPAKADKLYPFLKAYLETPPQQRNRFLLAYYSMRDRKPAPDVKAFLVGPGGRRPIAIAGDGHIQTLPSLADLNAGIQVEIEAAPSDKVGSAVEVLATMPTAAQLDTHQLILAMEQANAAIAAHAGIMSFAVPKLTCAYLFGAHSGQAQLANGHAIALPLRTGPYFSGTPYFDSVLMPDARGLVLDKAPSRIILGAKPKN